RKVWVAFTWLMTWWIPSFTLRWCGKMKREDIRMAWREKVALCIVIFFLSGVIIFFIAFFGKLLCPGAETLYSSKEVGYHQGTDDFFVSLRGIVYDISKFASRDHSNGRAAYNSGPAFMASLAGRDVSQYFPVPLTISCQ